jgi:putative transcriptional regulator
MFNKSFLTDKIVNSLLKKDFEVLITEGCFNVAAKNSSLMLIKSLINIDGFSEEHAQSLRSISYFLSANPLVVSIKNNRQFLDDQTIYSRFQLPVVTPQTFDNFLEEEKIEFFESSRGRHTSEVDILKIKNKRKEKGFSLRELAQLVGISKKAMYEIEKNRTKPSVETIDKLEEVLNIRIKVARKFETKLQATYIQPRTELQKNVSKEFSRIGIDNSSVDSAPFEIIGKESFSVITNTSSNPSLRKELPVMKKFAKIVSSKALLVAKKSKEDSLEGLPIFLEEELSELETPKDLDKRLKEKI